MTIGKVANDSALAKNGGKEEMDARPQNLKLGQRGK
jgi:hypothetical protein